MILIQSHTQIRQLQEEFNRAFPFLKLEFFKHSHYPYEGNARRDLVRSTDSLKNLHRKSSEDIAITETMTVTELEQLLSTYFGVSAQVFRKSGNSWLETTVTDDWTLKHQNDQGNELSQLRSS